MGTGTDSLVHGIKDLYFFGKQLKIKDFAVLLDPGRSDGFGNRHNIGLQLPAQNDLSR
ncbi:hypothetical protein D3C76_1848340 [compost metagenome]